MSKKLKIYKQKDIENRIFTYRGIQVMVDRDLAEMYGVETKRLNEQVKRNKERFPETFRFQLTTKERDELVANCDRLKSLKHSSSMPFVFTEQGVSMLSAVLKSETAIKVSIQIMNAFVDMRKIIGAHGGLIQRIDRIELRQAKHDQNFEKVFKALEGGKTQPQQGVFFEGQTFDAYSFASDLIRSAKVSIQLIDNYIDDSVLMLLTKRKKGTNAIVYTRNISPVLKQDLKKHNSQYEPISVKRFSKAHDRFLIIDEEKVYHIGASLKDLGKKWFAFSVIEKDALSILQKIKEI